MGISAADGTVAWTPLQAGAILGAHWAPVFVERHVGAEAMEDYPDYTVAAPHNFNWDVMVVEAAMLRTSDGFPGPDGVPYAAWRAQASRLAPMGHAAMQSFRTPST